MTFQLSLPARAILSVFIANVIFGVSFIFTKVALQYATPFVLLSCRFFVALLVFTLIMFIGRIKITMKDKPWPLLLLLGLFQPVIYFLGETYGVLYTSATFSAIIIALIPIASIWASAIFLKEAPTTKQSIFCCVSVLGVIIITASTTGGTNQLWGVLLLLMAVVADVAFNLLTRKLSVVFTPFERTYIMFIMGFVTFFSLALFESGGSLQPMLTAFTGEPLLPILYLGVASSVIALFLVNYANTLLPVTRTIVFINVTTLVSVIIGVCYLHEPFSLLAVFATGLIVLGIWGVQRYARREDELPLGVLLEEEE